MVSTLGAITGIAIGSQNQFTVILSGLVIIGVESVSMGVGSYLSNRISKEVESHTVAEEQEELISFPEAEKRELYRMFVRDGWPKHISNEMTKYAQANKKLMLREMQYRELGISPFKTKNPLKNAVFMFISYIIGGSIPLLPYFVASIPQAIPASTVITLTGLFLLGVATTKYTGSKPIASGLRIFILGGIALIVGMFVGTLAKLFQLPT